LCNCARHVAGRHDLGGKWKNARQSGETFRRKLSDFKGKLAQEFWNRWGMEPVTRKGTGDREGRRIEVPYLHKLGSSRIRCSLLRP